MAFNPQEFLGTAPVGAIPPQTQAPVYQQPAPQPVQQQHYAQAPQQYNNNNQGHVGGQNYSNNKQQWQQKPREPQHGRVYTVFNEKTRRSHKTITLTQEGVDYLFQNLGQLQSNPKAKVKIKMIEYSDQVKQSITQRGGHSEGAIYIKIDDGSRNFGDGNNNLPF